MTKDQKLISAEYYTLGFYIPVIQDEYFTVA